MSVCTGCALLCDDIEASVEEKQITSVKNACIKGAAHIKAVGMHRCAPRVEGREVSLEKAISRAAGILAESESPMLFGLSTINCEAQRAAIELARRLDARIDDTSSFCQGPIVEALLKKKIKTCTLEEVRDAADVLVYWGADPMNSQPRNLSKYSYFPRGSKRQHGYEEDRTAVAIDVRHSSTAKICKNHYYQIPPGSDAELMNAVLSATRGKLPKYEALSAKRVLELAGILKKAEHGVIFAGLGLVYTTHIEQIKHFMTELNNASNFHLIPVVGHYNMWGFNQTLYEETGFINKVKFEAGTPLHGGEYSLVESLKNNSVDTLLVLGANPLFSIPPSITGTLKNVKVICIDPHMTATAKQADVSIPSALTGVESGGSAHRTDGVPVTLEKMLDGTHPTDEEILRRIIEAVD